MGETWPQHPSRGPGLGWPRLAVTPHPRFCWGMQAWLAETKSRLLGTSRTAEQPLILFLSPNARGQSVHTRQMRGLDQSPALLRPFMGVWKPDPFNRFQGELLPATSAQAGPALSASRSSPWRQWADLVGHRDNILSILWLMNHICSHYLPKLHLSWPRRIGPFAVLSINLHLFIYLFFKASMSHKCNR